MIKIILFFLLLISFNSKAQMYIGDIVPHPSKCENSFQLWITNNIKVQDNLISYDPSSKPFTILVKYPNKVLFSTIPIKQLIEEHKTIHKEIALMNKCLLGYLQGKRILGYSTKGLYLENIEFK